MAYRQIKTVDFTDPSLLVRPILLTCFLSKFMFDRNCISMLFQTCLWYHYIAVVSCAKTCGDPSIPWIWIRAKQGCHWIWLMIEKPVWIGPIYLKIPSHQLEQPIIIFNTRDQLIHVSVFRQMKMTFSVVAFFFLFSFLVIVYFLMRNTMAWSTAKVISFFIHRYPNSIPRAYSLTPPVKMRYNFILPQNTCYTRTTHHIGCIKPMIFASASTYTTTLIFLKDSSKWNVMIIFVWWFTAAKHKHCKCWLRT